MKASAEQGGYPLCDSTTARAAGARFRFESLPALSLKGKSTPVTVLRPVAEANATGAAFGKAEDALLGRAGALEWVRERVDRLTRRGGGGVAVVEGEAGVGKSRILAYAAQRLRAAGVEVLTGAADPVEQTTPYFAWRSIFACLLRSESGTLAERVEALLPGSGGLAPLLSVVHDGAPADSEVTASLQGAARAERTAGSSRSGARRHMPWRRGRSAQTGCRTPSPRCSPRGRRATRASPKSWRSP